MTFHANRSWRSFLGATLVSGLLVAGAVGCDSGPKEKLLDAKMAVLNAKPDLAEKNLKPVLKADPDNFEGQRLMAKVDQLRGKYSQAEEKFLALQQAEGFASAEGDDAKENAKKLTTEQKKQKAMLENDLPKLYLAWANSLDPAEDMATFEQVAQKGLEFSPKQPRLNTMLVEAYQNQAKKLVEQGKKIEAADVYEKIPPLYTSSAIRSKARERASNLRFEAGRAEMLEYFNKTAKPKLVADERYDAENKQITFQVKQDAEEVEKYVGEKQDARVRLDPRKEQGQKIIQQYAISKKLKPALVAVVVEATGVPEDSDFSQVGSPKGLEIVEVEPSRNELSINARIPLDAVLKVGFDVREKTRLDAEAAKKKPADADKQQKNEGVKKADKGEADKEAAAK